MSELLLKINAAKRDDLFNPDPPSTVSRITRIRDSDTCKSRVRANRLQEHKFNL